MPDHVHLLVQRNTAASGLRPLDMLVRDLKARVKNEARARALLASGEQLWQRGYFDRVVRTPEEHDALRVYIETNPLRWSLRRQRAST